MQSNYRSQTLRQRLRAITLIYVGLFMTLASHLFEDSLSASPLFKSAIAGLGEAMIVAGAVSLAIEPMLTRADRQSFAVDSGSDGILDLRLWSRENGPKEVFEQIGLASLRTSSLRIGLMAEMSYAALAAVLEALAPLDRISDLGILLSSGGTPHSPLPFILQEFTPRSGLSIRQLSYNLPFIVILSDRFVFLLTGVTPRLPEASHRTPSSTFAFKIDRYSPVGSEIQDAFSQWWGDAKMITPQSETEA